MIGYEEACELALGHYRDTLGIEGIYSPYDIGNAWVFNGGSENEHRIGIQKIAISKENGKIESFNLPSPKNFALLESGTALDLPEKYR